MLAFLRLHMTLVTMALLLAAASGQASYKEIDGIVAIVDDDVVLNSELIERVDTIRKQLVANNRTSGRP